MLATESLLFSTVKFKKGWSVYCDKCQNCIFYACLYLCCLCTSIFCTSLCILFIQCL